MAKAVVDKGACVGCETCVGTCPVEAISMVDGKAFVDESCIECGSCEAACPFDVAVLEKMARTATLFA